MKKLLKIFETASKDGATPIGVDVVSDSNFDFDEVNLAAYYLDKPEVLATGGAVANVTGDGTVYTLAFPISEIDIGSNFASNTFTAPVDGRYAFDINLAGSGITGMTLFTLSIYVNGVESIKLEECDAANYGSATFAVSRGTIVSMGAGDTATAVLKVTGGSKVLDIISTRLYARLWSL
jgi:hypothetical protein